MVALAGATADHEYVNWVGGWLAVLFAALVRLDDVALWLVFVYVGMFARISAHVPEPSLENVFSLVVFGWNFSSSFAEESHLAFKFVLQTVCVLRRNWAAAALLRLSSELNPAGDKWRLVSRPVCLQLEWKGWIPCFAPFFVVVLSKDVTLVRKNSQETFYYFEPGLKKKVPLGVLVSLHSVFPSSSLACVCLAVGVLSVALKKQVSPWVFCCSWLKETTAFSGCGFVGLSAG